MVSTYLQNFYIVIFPTTKFISQNIHNVFYIKKHIGTNTIHDYNNGSILHLHNSYQNSIVSSILPNSKYKFTLSKQKLYVPCLSFYFVGAFMVGVPQQEPQHLFVMCHEF
jgi:hypothetical protein